MIRKLKCSLCDSRDIEIISESRIKDSQPVLGDGSFTPTASDFGIFYRLARCRRCRGIFSILTKEALTEIYAAYKSHKDALYLSQIKEKDVAFKNILSQIRKFSPSLTPHLLDIGCSYGTFLKLAVEAGMEACGIDISEDASRYCREALRLDVRCQDIETSSFSENYFDVVTAIETIEHIYDLKSFISHIHRILKRNGILYIVTPNVRSLSAKLLGRRWWSYRRMHIYYFSKNGLCEFLEKNGFSVIYSNPYRKTFKVDYLMDKLRKVRNNRSRFFYYLIDYLPGSFIKNLKITTSLGDIAVLAKKV